MDVKDYAALALGAYASVLSTLNFFQARRRDLVRIGVFVHIETRKFTIDDDVVLAVAIHNLGQRPTTVSAPQIHTHDGNVVEAEPLSESDSFPRLLKEGEMARWSVAVHNIHFASMEAGRSFPHRVRVSVKDPRERRHVSEWIELPAP